jgi:hypothetical protein
MPKLSFVIYNKLQAFYQQICCKEVDKITHERLIMELWLDLHTTNATVFT